MASKRTTPSTAEKDRIVYSVNWKETAILQKRLQVLEKSKRKVERRLSMDQKIVNKRFQQKIFRSRVSHARMWGDREKLRELVPADRFTLNTSLNGDDKYEVDFRSRNALLRRPKSMSGWDSSRCRRDVCSARPATAIPSSFVVDDDNDDAGSSAQPEAQLLVVETVPASPKGGVKVRPMTAFAASKKQTRSALAATQTAEKPRPYTADNNGDDVKQRNQNEREEEKFKEQGDASEQERLSGEASAKQTGVVSFTATKDSEGGAASTESGGPRQTETATPLPYAARLTRPKIKRKSVSAAAASGGAERSQPPFSGGRLFEEDDRPTLLQIDQRRVQSARYPQRVRTFTDSLRPLKRDWDRDLDYYTERVSEMALRESRHKLHVNIHESEGEKRDALKSVGDIRSRNMTFGSVSQDYYDYFHGGGGGLGASRPGKMITSGSGGSVAVE